MPSPTHDPTEALAADPSDCPICGERDSPEAGCANCGWHIRPCGDALGLCVYAGPHEGPHKIAVSWRTRLDRLSAAGWHLTRAGDEELSKAATFARDMIANWCFNEDDSGDDNDLVAAYDRLREVLGPSTEEGIAAALDSDR